ncbi:unnamed protein product [Tilletia laevis]|uniref:Uncharacterized protein n=3 Tax=Tilletia TaxID=13289 RepID=A0A8X7MTF7_9BASI|nr:hypothetical protein CF336_g3584 [Tilletia laevis]KAE8199195.1 hypothetical protein CF328_g3319 [Tilletia controversa]KAE8261846.1 hypothetical protein A4X03_0g2922 [Tilletia caries]KAE8204027.1 hypothetical protein CF335_g2801 [Tilletia laevis]KAE8248072.1 hypothetical protein A4X06_0g3979 [Tilletia controversa]
MALHLLRQRALPLLQPQLRSIPSLSHELARATTGPVKALFLSNVRSFASAVRYSQPSLSSTFTQRAIPQIALSRQGAKLSIGSTNVPMSTFTNGINLTQAAATRSFTSSSLQQAGRKAKATPFRARQPVGMKARGATKTQGQRVTVIRAARTVCSRPHKKQQRRKAELNATSAKAPPKDAPRPKYSLDVNTSKLISHLDLEQSRTSSTTVHFVDRYFRWLKAQGLQNRKMSTSTRSSSASESIGTSSTSASEVQRVPPPLPTHNTSPPPQPGARTISDLVASSNSFSSSNWTHF